MNRSPPIAVWRVEVLGGMRVVSGDTVLTRFGSRRIGALLVRLALAPQRTHSREELIDLIWPDADLATGRNRLRHALSTLRRLLQPPGAGDVLLADRNGVRLNSLAVACDAVDFERLARSGRAAEALALYRGELLPGFFDDWVQEARSRLEAIYERLRDTEAALPGERDAPAATIRPPAVPGVGVTWAPDRQLLLPSYLSAFFGRSREVEDLARLVRLQRLVTVRGVGGCGKTRLAIEVARTLADRFETLLFVGLAGVERPEGVFEGIGRALRLSPGGQAAEVQVSDFLMERDALLVLDNFEHLVAAGGAVLVERLLGTLPRLHCLVTSRRLLQIEGEREFALAPLPLPEMSPGLDGLTANPGVALFIDRARGARPDFQVTPRNAGDLAALMRALEGVPLAIELAAARSRVMSVTEMACEIAARRDWVARASRHVARDPRHLSLHAAIDWSWRLLEPAQRQCLRNLTVLRGSWTAAAAAAVTGFQDARAMLESLLADSLLQSQTDAWGQTRFSMLEMIREFVAMQDDDAELAPARARHRRYFVEELRAGAKVDAARLSLDLANVERALASGFDDRALGDVLDLAVALRPYADARGLSPRLVELCVQAAGVAQDGDTRASSVRMLLAEAFTVSCCLDEALVHARRALDLAEPGLAEAEAVHVLARTCWERNLSAREHGPRLRRALATAQAEGAGHLQARVLLLLGNIACKDEHDLAQAEDLYRQAAEIAQRHALARLAAQCRHNLGMIARNQRRFDQALRDCDDLIRDCHRRGDVTMLADVLHERGLILTDMRRWEEAVAAQRECVEHCWNQRVMITLLYALWNLARPLARTGAAEAAVRLIGFAAACWQQRGGQLSDEDRRYVRRVRGLTSTFIGQAEADAALREGSALGLAEAVALVLRRPQAAAAG